MTQSRVKVDAELTRKHESVGPLLIVFYLLDVEPGQHQLTLKYRKQMALNLSVQ